MALKKIIRGEDIPFMITFTKADGTPYAFADFIQAVAHLMINKKPFKTYSKSGGDLEATADPDKALIKLLNSETINLPVGELELRVKITITDANFAGGRRDIQIVEKFNVID